MTEQSHSGELLLASLVAFLDQKETDIVRGNPDHKNVAA